MAQHEQLEITLCSSAAAGVHLTSGEPHPIVQASSSKLLAVGDIVLAVNGVALTEAALPIESADETPLMLQVRPFAALATGAAATSKLELEGPWSHLRTFGDSPAATKLAMPGCLTVLPNGDVAVGDGGNCRVLVCSPDGCVRSMLGSFGDAPGLLNYPAGIAAGGEALYVADRGNCRLQKLRLSDGAHLATSEGPHAAAAAPTAAPAAAASSSSASADESGRSSGVADSPPPLLLHPWGIALDGAAVLVCDQRGGVLAFARDDLRLLRTLRLPSRLPTDGGGGGGGAPEAEASVPDAEAEAEAEAEACATASPSLLDCPSALAVHAGELYVCDHAHHRLVVLPLHGQPPWHDDGTVQLSDAPPLADKAAELAREGPAVRVIGERGEAPGQFELPIGVCILPASSGAGSSSSGGGGGDGSGGGGGASVPARLVVSEFGGRRVQLLTLAGAPLQVLRLPGGDGGRLLGVCCDANGEHIYVGDYDTDAVHVFGSARTGVGPTASSPSDAAEVK